MADSRIATRSVGPPGEPGEVDGALRWTLAKHPGDDGAELRRDAVVGHVQQRAILHDQPSIDSSGSEKGGCRVKLGTDRHLLIGADGPAATGERFT